MDCSRRFRALLCFGSVIGASLEALAGQPVAIPLEHYLRQGRASGLNLIYASSLVRPNDQILVDPDAGFSLDVLKTRLRARGIEVRRLRSETYVLRRLQVTEPTEKAAVSLSGPVLEEVVVHSSRYHWSRRTDDSARFDSEELNSRPVPANDALRVVNQLPGSASVGLSARPHVRGGRENETLIELDTVRLYRPFHFSSYNSLYSIFDQRIFQEMEFFSGAYPVRFGDGLSAAMSLHPPELEQLEDRRELSIGLYQYSWFYGSQRADHATTFSIRRSTPEVGQFLEEPNLGHPAYGDIFARYQRDNDNGYRWSINALWYEDDLELGDLSLEQATVHERSGYVWGRLQSSPAAALSWESTLGVGYIDSDRQGTLTQPQKVTAQLAHTMQLQTVYASQDFRWLNEPSELTFGWDYRHVQADYSLRSERLVAPVFASLSDIAQLADHRYQGRQRADYGALYLAWKRRLTEGFFVDVGVRGDAQHFDDRSDIEPAYRLALLYAPSTNVDIRLTRGRYTQSQSLDDLAIVDGVRAPGAPQVADQTVLAATWFIPSISLELRGEVYRKDVSSVAAYFDNLSNAFTLLPELQPDRVRIAPDRYRADGAEFSVTMPLGPLSLWANYAISQAADRFFDIEVARSWDQSRTLNVGALTDVAEWSLSLALSQHEGWLSTFLALDGDRVVAGERNGQRFDHFLSLDAKAVRQWKLADSSLRLELGITNLFDRKNEVGINYRLADNGGGLIAQPFYSLRRTAFFDLFWSL